MFSFRAYNSLYRLVVFLINNKGRGKYATGFRQSNGLHVNLSTILRTPNNNSVRGKIERAKLVFFSFFAKKILIIFSKGRKLLIGSCLERRKHENKNRNEVWELTIEATTCLLTPIWRNFGWFMCMLNQVL